MCWCYKSFTRNIRWEWQARTFFLLSRAIEERCWSQSSLSNGNAFLPYKKSSQNAARLPCKEILAPPNPRTDSLRIFLRKSDRIFPALLYILSWASYAYRIFLAPSRWYRSAVFTYFCWIKPWKLNVKNNKILIYS